ncbi:uncharacterized protein J7T54_004253 [Emericellopsis cladophorae]|uniref:Phosphoglycerate mutase n=1 Tax=Emericellopsis cladophorae TaxID=2686198 RepID=A0A9P9XZ53_9HYPO|nr:uncharacterized protein J7T54_004253 [Emericellopsis cladophorae]KAI6780120.1 hypothetical protein J7T54_004253 [Emericellopsis cladophorae]
MAPMAPRWKFEAVPDVFKDLSELQTDPKDKVTTQPGLGLLSRSYPTDDMHEKGQQEESDWTRLVRYVAALNGEASSDVRHKVLYLTRHGVGYHNLKSAEVGEDAWNNHWSLKDTDGVTTWFDAFLAPEGETQARELSTFWSALTTSAAHGAPLPQRVYTSPLSRCLQTTEFVYGPLFPKAQFHPIIKEDLRERWTLHTCDRRRPRSWIAENWESKGYVLEAGFTEEDELAKKDERCESDAEHGARKQRALEDVWNADQGDEFVALVCHSMAIRAILAVVGANLFRVREGSSIALLVKGTKMG